MLIEFKVSNYRSIKDEVVLSLDSATIKSLSNNTFDELDYSLLKSAVIYGANASGKSNIISSILFAWHLVRDSVNYKIDTKLLQIPFLLSDKTRKEPSKFEFTFIKNNTRYIYGFSCTQDGFVEEYLRYKPEGENWKYYFKRDETKEEKFKFYVDSNKQTKWGIETSNKKLYLPNSVNTYNYESLKEVYNFIVEDMAIVTNINNASSNWRTYTRKKLLENQEFRTWAEEIMQKADFGGILGLKIEKQERSVNEIELIFEEGAVTHKRTPKRKEAFYDLSFVHKDDSGNEVLFKEDLQSFGTNKTLDMLGPIYDILENGKTLFIDEFELNLHPNITEFIIKLFHSKHNKKNGQLIVTTHDTTLLKNKDLFRRDQVYICSKAPNKWTELNSLMNFDLRETLSFENAYLNGRVGGLPFIDENFFEE